ncbi:MAG: hypothetical protein OEY14_13545 [Myxococcales bacterium]|nr:hypothetical protein [Myxococcales bacterium]
MIQGAVIGFIVALVMVLMRASQQKKGGRKILAAMSLGAAEARAALDAYIKPARGKVRTGRLLELLERLSWLAIIGAHDDLEQEAASLEGGLNVVTQLRAQAAVGLLVHRTEPRDLEQLRAVAARIEAEGGVLSKLVKATTRDLAIAAGGLAQEVPEAAVMRRVFSRAAQLGPAQKIVLYRFLARVAEASGNPPAVFRREAEQALAKLQA